MTFKRLEPKVRKQQIIVAALKLATSNGFQNIRRDAVAVEANVAPGLVSKYWGTMTQLRRAVMREAVKTENLKVIAQGLALGDKVATKASEHIRKKAIQQLASN